MKEAHFFNLQSLIVSAEVTFIAVQFIHVKSFFSLSKFIGPKNPLWLPVLPILCFCAGAQKNMAAKFKGRAKKK